MSYDTIKFLNLEDFPIDISSFHVSKSRNILTAYFKLINNTTNCIHCEGKEIVIKDYRMKKVKHSISNASSCFLGYKARRFFCRKCLKTFYESNPFSIKGESISLYTKLAVLEDLKDFSLTFTAIASKYHLSVAHVLNIFDSYVKVSRRKIDSVVCFDEIYTSKLSKHKYAFVIFNFLERKIVDLYPSRKKYHVLDDLIRIPQSERDQVSYIVIDMWETYKTLAKSLFKNARIAVDSFHVIKHLNDAIIKIRLKTMRKYDSRTDKLVDNHIFYYMMKKFHYFFTKDFETIYSGPIRIPKLKTKWDKHAILRFLLTLDPDLEYVYHLKERYREFNKAATEFNARDEFIPLLNSFLNSHLEEFREFGRLLRHWQEEIIHSFVRVKGQRLSNGPLENTNSKIKTIIKSGNGYTNFHRFRNRVLYSINGDVPIQGNPK